jgi:AcrR family transcriptional regulator
MKLKKISATTEERIKEAAKKVFVQKGYSGARMQDIANEAKINKALLHYYFRSKDQLFELIFMENVQKMMPKINSIIDSDDKLFDKIEKFVAEYLAMLTENPFLPLFVVNELSSHPERFFQKIAPLANGGLKVNKFIQQIQDETAKGKIIPISPVTLLMNTISLCVFPYLGKPMIQFVFGFDELQYRMILEQRKQEVASFIINSIKK